MNLNDVIDNTNIDELDLIEQMFLYYHIKSREFSAEHYECRKHFLKERDICWTDPDAPMTGCTKCHNFKHDWGLFSGIKEQPYNPQKSYDSPKIHQLRKLFEKDMPINGKTKVSIGDTSQTQFEKQILTASKDLKVLNLWHYKGDNLDILQNFKNLEMVMIGFCNKLQRFWDFSKTPNLKVLLLHNLKIYDFAFLKQAKSLEFLSISNEYGAIDSLSWISELNSLKYLTMGEVADGDISPIINSKSLEKMWISPTAFTTDAFAMLESRRSDIITNIENGIYTTRHPNPESRSSYTVGKRNYKDIKYSLSEEKLNSYKQKYADMMQKYKTVDYVPPVTIKKELVLPTEEMRLFWESTGENKTEAINQLEKVLIEYHSKMSCCDKKASAKKIVKDIVIKIKLINDDCYIIETEESANLCDFITNYFNENWHEELEEILENNRDW